MDELISLAAVFFECRLGVGNRLLHCSKGRSAIWETILITQEADFQIGRENASNRPGRDIRAHSEELAVWM